jgi:hypothetical protein
MIILIIVLYILNVFLNRFLNKVLYRVDDGSLIVPWFWFLSLICTIMLIISIIIELYNKEKYRNNWFTGKHW